MPQNTKYNQILDALQELLVKKNIQSISVSEIAQKHHARNQADSAVHSTQKRRWDGASKRRRESGQPVRPQYQQKIHQEIQYNRNIQLGRLALYQLSYSCISDG